MHKIFLFPFLALCISGAAFAQLGPIGSGSVLTYDLFSAKQQPHQKDSIFQPDKGQRVLKLNIEKNGDRTYTLPNEQPFSVYDQYLAVTSELGKPVERGARYPLLPMHQKIDVGGQWNFSRQGHASACGNWRVAYHAMAKEGPDTVIQIDGKDVAVKTLLIEYRGDAKSDKCDSYQQERLVLYAPGLNELLMDQWIEFIPGHMTSDNGYKWTLKSVTTSASQVSR